MQITQSDPFIAHRLHCARSSTCLRCILITSRSDQLAAQKDDRPRVVMIMGLACTMGGWNPQLDELLAADEHGRPLTQVRWLSALFGLFLCALARVHWPGGKTSFRKAGPHGSALPPATACACCGRVVAVLCCRPAGRINYYEPLFIMQSRIPDRCGTVQQGYLEILLNGMCYHAGARHGQPWCWEVQHATQSAGLHFDLHGL